jgi:hypothetical protein
VTDRTTRDEIAEALALHLNGPASDGQGWYRTDEQRDECYAQADLVMAVLRKTAPIPCRGDQFEQWLKTQRDQHREQTDDWILVDELLDQYRLHADTGTPLDQHVCEGGSPDDCASCYEDAKARRQ